MEIIGGVGIEIVGDYSGLQGDLDAAQALAVSGASKINDALDLSTPDTAPVTAALQQVSDAATTTGQSIAAALDVQIPALDLSQATESLVALGEAATASAGAIGDSFSSVGSVIQAGIAPVDDFYSALAKLTDAGASIDEAFQQLTGDTQSFMDALSSGGLNEFIDNFGKVGTESSAAADGLSAIGNAASGAAEQLGLFDAEIQVSYADAAGQLNLFTTQLEPIAGAAQSAAEAAAALGDAVGKTGEESSAATSMLRGYGDAALELLQAQRDADAELSTAQEALGQIQAAYSLGEASANDLARAEQAVASAFDTANPSIEESGKAADDAAVGLKEMASALVAIGTALAITSGLETLAKDALEASDEVARTTISLTALTGSATQAAGEIQNLEDLANSDALSFPKLQQAAVSMTALLGPTTDVEKNLRAIADGAAVMGTSIDAAAKKFDTIAEAGTASARALATLGLNLGDLAKAMNSLGLAQDATADSAAKLFKALDISERVDVLDTALAKFAGDAEKLAGTLSGQWTTLGNQIDQALRQIGDALTPLATQLLNFANTSVIPFIEDLIKDFQSLPEPVQNTAIALGVLVGSLAPIAAGLGAIGLAVAAAQTAIPALTALVESLGISSAATAIEEEAAAVATTHLGEAAAAAAGESGLGGLVSGATLAEGALSGLVGVIGVGLLSATVGAVAAFSDLKAGMAAVEQQAGATNDAFQKWIQAQVDVAIKSGDIADAQDKVKTALDNAGISAQKAADLLNQLAAAQKTVVGIDWKGYASDLGLVVTNLDLTSAATQKLYDAQGKANDALSSAKQVLADVKQDYADGEASVMDLNRAVADYEKAQKAANVATDESKQSQKDAAAAVKEHAAELKTLNDALNSINTILGSVADSYKQYTDALTTGSKTAAQELGTVTTAIDGIEKKMLTLHDPALLQGLQDWVSKLNDAKQTLTDFANQDAWNKLSAQISLLADKFPQQIGEMTGSLKDFVNQALATADAVPAAFNKIDPATLIGKWLTEQKALDDQTLAMTKHFTDMGLKYTEAVQNEVIPITVSLQDRLNQVDKTFQQVGVDASHIFDTTAIGAYLKAVQDLNAAGITTLQQQEAQIGNLDNLLAKAQAYNIPLGEQLDLQGKILQAQIKLGEETGADVDAQVLGLEKVKLAQEALTLSAHGLADQYVAMINDLLKGFDQLGTAMAGAIVNGTNLGAALVGEFKKIGQSILADVINAALIPLKLALVELIGGLLPGLNLGLTTIGGGLGAVNQAAGQASAGLTALAQAAQAAAANINSSVGGAGDVSGAGGGITSTIGAVSAVVSAGAAVASAILLAHISSDTGHIEVNTRSCLAELENARADQWDQYNGMYARLGEVLNAVNGVYDKLSTLTITATASVLTPTDSKALENIGDSAAPMVADLNIIAANTAYTFAKLVDINSQLDVAFGGNSIYDTLMMINASILTVVSAINYGAQSGKSYSDQSAEATRELANDISNGAMSAHADLSRVDTSIQAGTSAGRTNTQLTVDQQIAKRQDDIAAAQAAADSAMNIAAQIDALRSEYSSDIAAMNDALRAGNIDLATQYQHAAAAVQSQITPLLSSTATNTGDTATYVEAAGNQTAYAATGAGVLVSAAVGQSAATISQAVIGSAAASASLFNSGLSSLSSIIGAFGRAGGGLPGGQTGLPSGSGLGNTNPNGTPVYTIPGVSNPGVINGEQPGFNPNAPATGGMSQAQWNATGHNGLAPDWWLNGTPQPGINQSNVPHFLTGGTVEVGGVAVVDKDEIVIPADQAIAVKSGEAVISSPHLAANGGASTIFTNQPDASSPDPNDHGPSTDGDFWIRLADAMGLKPGTTAGHAAAYDDTGNPITGPADKTPLLDPAALAVMAKPGIEITSVAQTIATSTQATATALTSIANGPMSKTPIVDSGGQPVQIVSISAAAVAAMQANQSGAVAQSGPSQQDLLAASMNWLNAQQGLSDSDKASSISTYQNDAKAGLLPSPKASGAGFSGYNPYSTPSFDMGGPVGMDMLAMVHAGEWVIPKDGKVMLPPAIMARIQMPTLPGAPNVPDVPISTSGSGSNDSYAFNIYGITDPDLLMREISSRVKTRTGRTAKFSN